jgi:hypothetical protein
MSKTPRTDSITFVSQPGMMPPYDTVPAAFARELEMELNETEQRLHALRLVCGTTDANKFETALDRANARIAELEQDGARLDFLAENPESVPYLHNGLWRIPYLMSGAGGFGGVAEMAHQTVRGVIDTAMKGHYE